ncbi:LysR family transcriptional regulator [Marinomonas rhizomae]|uniref:LysR family transcriptional regulator n=1 Tax=Marinomonas rhizomae TaxID=491948 RepID=A0A366J4N3_9GAMM|nr:LysR family transcriptional regulator [Marinomonas rhizomae]RBP81214.1 LysR family transcriptional regulator [Marinomonas rhizomae]RNF72366.1 LysR family transcriptional regulator [Marinomonas rhizomae]
MSTPNSTFPLTLKQCRVIREIMKKGTEKEASSSLNLSQSSVSRVLSQAEQALQVNIFTRGWSGAEPTSAGEVVISSCNSILKAISDAEHQLQSNVPALLKLTTYVEWRHLLIIEAVVKVGSASVAAQTLGMTQPSVSKALKEVENMVQQPLFSRARRGLIPQAAAKQLASLFLRVSPVIQSLHHSLQSLPNELTGRLSVGMLSFSCQDIVPIAFASIFKQHSGIRLQAMQGPYHMLANALRQGEIDCFLGLMRKGPIHPELIELPLLRARYALIARSDHPVHDYAKKLGDLINERWIVARHGTPIRDYFESLFHSIDNKPPIQALEMLTFASSEELVIHSEAIALLFYDDWNINKLNPRLKQIPIPLPSPECTIGITLHRERQSSIVQTFIEELRLTIIDKLKQNNR